MKTFRVRAVRVSDFWSKADIGGKFGARAFQAHVKAHFKARGKTAVAFGFAHDVGALDFFNVQSQPLQYFFKLQSFKSPLAGVQSFMAGQRGHQGALFIIKIQRN